jgi:Insertion element 4 transposase N-terminal/Transposase DDE domain
VVEFDSGRLTDHVSFGALTRIVPRHVVDDVLARSGKVEKRCRILPAHVVVYFVLALSLFTDGYEEVVRKLVNGLRFARTWSSEWKVPTTGALSQARTRLGAEPMRQIFDAVAVPVAGPGNPGAWLRDYRLTALDGVMIDMPDTPENRDEFPKPQGDTPRPFPQTRIIGLVEIGSHATLGIQIGTILVGERELASRLTGKIEPDMLVLADRGFFSYELWRTYLQAEAQLLWRVPANLVLPVLQLLPDGSYISEITKQNRKIKSRIDADKIDDIMLATHIPVRVVEYTVAKIDNEGERQSETFRIVTSLLTPGITAEELARAYHERWEIESAFREIEIYLRQGKGIRSKTPELVRQEIYGLFTTHYAIRSFMSEAADTVETDPDRISFTRTLNIVRRRISDPAEFSPRSTTSPTPPRHS